MPTQTEPGEYVITAIDEKGFNADAIITVIDMTGPPGTANVLGCLLATRLRNSENNQGVKTLGRLAP